MCGNGASCAIDCTNANNCDEIECPSGAECVMLCTGANNCTFDVCPGGATSCPDAVVVCNRDCPSCGDGVCDVGLESAESCAQDCD